MLQNRNLLPAKKMNFQIEHNLNIILNELEQNLRDAKQFNALIELIKAAHDEGGYYPVEKKNTH